MSHCFHAHLSSVSHYGGEPFDRSMTSAKEEKAVDKLSFFPEFSPRDGQMQPMELALTFSEDGLASHIQDPYGFPEWQHWTLPPLEHSWDSSELWTLDSHQIFAHDQAEEPGRIASGGLELEPLGHEPCDCFGNTVLTEADSSASSAGCYLLDQNCMENENVPLLPKDEDIKWAELPLIVEEERHSADETLDMLFEQAYIVDKMLGRNAKLDSTLVRDLNLIVEAHQSFRIASPQHCRDGCNFSSDPLDCCWMTKYKESRLDPKQSLQKDLTYCVIEYANKNGIKICNLPEHCESYLREWAELNFANPYMTKTTLSLTAQTLGVQVKQVSHWLENWRTRKWSPLGTDRKGRKGKHFRHPRDDTNIIKEWMLKMGRYPSKREAQDLSKDLNMSCEEIRTWCCNFRKRNKHLFPVWNINCARLQQTTG